MFREEELELLLKIIRQGLLQAFGETLLMTFVPTILAFAIGLPLGILLVTGEEKGIHPLPPWLLWLMNFIINILRSVPFLILLIVALPLSKILIGTRVGAKAMLIPLVVAAFPFVSRLVENSIREVDPGVVEAAQSMGASTFQIIWKVLIPEARPSLISNFMVSLITIFGYGAMSGAVGGGGIGRIAVNYGYNRYMPLVMLFSVVLLVILVQIFQSIGNCIVKKSDKRIH
ncbi:MAG: ABC transporter permease [Oscillospiraceae bacterium]|nr:ABC transporter permease [Oscillospiraceae bacterium]